MDALSDVLRVAHLTGGVFLHAEFTAPWCIAAHPSPEACSPFFKSTTSLIPYHYVVDGEAKLELWYDRDDRLAKIRFAGSDGVPIEYRRRD